MDSAIIPGTAAGVRKERGSSSEETVEAVGGVAGWDEGSLLAGEGQHIPAENEKQSV